MGQLQKIESELVALGYQILAISADRHEKLAASGKQNSVTYRLLSDNDLEAARAFGIAFQVDAGMVKRLKGFGIDLEEASGRDHHWLPVPGAFVAGTDGVIDFVYVNPDYKVRVDPDALIAAAKEALE